MGNNRGQAQEKVGIRTSAGISKDLDSTRASKGAGGSVNSSGASTSTNRGASSTRLSKGANRSTGSTRAITTAGKGANSTGAGTGQAGVQLA